MCGNTNGEFIAYSKNIYTSCDRLINEESVMRSCILSPQDDSQSKIFAPPIMGDNLNGKHSNKIFWTTKETAGDIREDQLEYC